MDTIIERKQTAFRLSTALVERLREEAARQNRSLNNLVETILTAAMQHRPNSDTMEAIREAREGKELETLDLNHFKEFVESL